MFSSSDGIKYSTGEHFGRNLYRTLRFRYPTMMFGDVNFEIDEDGTPWWICSRLVKRIGLFGGADAQGAVLVERRRPESPSIWRRCPTGWIGSMMLTCWFSSTTTMAAMSTAGSTPGWVRRASPPPRKATIISL